MKTIPMNADREGNCKTITTGQGRLGLENYLGRLEHGGWDCQMTSILEVYDTEQEACTDNGEGREDEVRGGQYPLDAYNQKVITDGSCYTVTTRTFGDNNHFLMEIYETD